MGSPKHGDPRDPPYGFCNSIHGASDFPRFPEAKPAESPGGEAKLGPAVAGLGCKPEGNSIAINKKTQKRCDNDHFLFF